MAFPVRAPASFPSRISRTEYHRPGGGAVARRQVARRCQSTPKANAFVAIDTNTYSPFCSGV